MREVLTIHRSAEILLEFDKVKKAGAFYAASPLGRELFVALKPLTSLQPASRELAQLKEMIDLLNRDEEVPIDGLDDPRTILEKLGTVGGFLEGKELLNLATFLKAIKHLKDFVTHHRKNAPLLYERFKDFIPLPELIELIRSKIDDEGLVKDGASPLLKKLKRTAREAEAHIHAELQRLIRTLSAQNILQETYHTLRGDRFVLPIRAGAKGRIRGIIHDVSHSGETYFIEPIEVVELSNRLATIRLEIREEIRRILIEISQQINAELPSLQKNVTLAAQFDLLFAKARFAFVNNFAIPELTPNGTLKLLHAHHPLLYLKDKESSVPLTINLNKEDRVLVISGPNAGGKTTALKTIGLLSMMVQAGLAIPAFPDSRFPLFTKWFADIGDEQDVTEGISTFSAHIRNLSYILREASSTSLVLLDELGTATDPTEGGALAVSILENLAKRAALTIVTSHLSPLKAWAHHFPEARNASFRLDEVTQKPSFQIMLDVPGASEAFLIAEREGLPSQILRRASELLSKGEADLSRLIQSLHQKQKEIEKKEREIADLVKEHKKLHHHLRELQEYLQQKEHTLTRDMLSAKESLLAEARRFIEKQIAHLPSREAMAQARREITKEIQSVQKQQRRLKEKFASPVDPYKFFAGQTVYLADMNEYGEIKKIDRERRIALVVLKGIEVTAPLEKLKIPAEGEIQREFSPRVSYPRRSDMSIELDLHGMRVDEMLGAVEQYLNDAVLADLPYVRLVHGIGTGALRRALHDYLRNHPLAKSYRYGTPDEGGAGVTIVNL